MNTERATKKKIAVKDVQQNLPQKLNEKRDEKSADEVTDNCAMIEAMIL